MHDLKIGFLLGIRQIQRASLWTTLLIISVVLFTFMNLVALSGILIGIVDGALSEIRAQSLGDVIIKPLDGESRIKETERVLSTLQNYSEIQAFSPRYTGLATLEANYKERRNLSEEPDVVSISLTGIDPATENRTSRLGRLITDGEYLDEDDNGYILIGKFLIDRYANDFGDGYQSLANIYPGDTIMVTVGDQSKEFIVKGIVDSKVDAVTMTAYITDREFRRMFDRADYNANQIAIRLHDVSDELTVRDRLRQSDLSSLAKINSFTEDIPKFIKDVRTTFDILGIFTGAIGLAVASITIFIVIFINAMSRRRQIGILKAIGISRTAIECAYITQAGFYALAGAALGILITQFLIVPYFILNPIDFPFSNSSLSITPEGMLIRSGALLVVSLIAGFIPAWMITRQNTLSAILGRK